MAFLDLLADRGDDSSFFVKRSADGLDGLSSLRHALDDRYVHISEKHKSQCSRDRCRGHDERMDAVVGAFFRGRSLLNTETVLLVRDHQRQIREDILFRKHRVGTH